MRLAYSASIDTDGRSLVCFGGPYPSAEAFAAKAWEHAEFYARDRGYPVTCDTSAHCASCFGEGQVPKLRGRGCKTCPDCKGRGK